MPKVCFNYFSKAGITKDTPDPVGGIILRNSKGEPNGILLENAGNMILDKAFDIEKYPGKSQFLKKSSSIY
jgi:predicted amidohydrolase YtcJ